MAPRKLVAEAPMFLYVFVILDFGCGQMLGKSKSKWTIRKGHACQMFMSPVLGEPYRLETFRICLFNGQHPGSTSDVRQVLRCGM